MSQFLYSLTLVFVFLASANTQITADTSPSYSKNHKMFVKTACNSTTYPDKCYKSLSSYSSTIKSDPIKLCTTALKLNVNSAKEAASVISKLLKKSQKSAAGRKNKMLPEKLILRDCLEEMRDTIVELKQAITEMKTLRDGDSVPEHMTNVRTWVSAALTDEGTCTDGFEEIKVNKETIPLPSLSATDDSYVWEVDGNELQEFSTSKTWSQVRNRATEQRWTQNIWFKGHTPRHAFTTWVAHQDRLPTRTRLVAWGMQIPSLCCLCSLVDESRDHLFLRCEVSGTVWGYVLRRLGYSHRGFHTWVAFTDWMRLRDTVVSVTLKRVAAQATIASIWTERNKRLHDGVSQTPASLFKKIDRNVRDTILGKRKTALFQHLMQEWLRHE